MFNKSPQMKTIGRQWKSRNADALTPTGCAHAKRQSEGEQNSICKEVTPQRVTLRKWKDQKGGSRTLTLLDSLNAKQQRGRAAVAQPRTASLAGYHDIANSDDILAAFVSHLHRRQVVGEDKNAMILYLAAVTRLFAKPVSIAIKGASAGGKSYLVESVLCYFPRTAYYAVSAFSEKALAYLKEPLKHRVLVIYEAAGIGGSMASYFIRSLLSEHCIKYETVESSPDGPRSKTITIEGPTNLFITTTETSLHPENETRLLSLIVQDTREKIAHVLKARAAVNKSIKPNTKAWRSFQEWIALGDKKVVVPFAESISELIIPVAPRLTRDIDAVFSLVKAHALIHQKSRNRRDGRIVATIHDYAVVRRLVRGTINRGVGAEVSQNIRRAVDAVDRLQTSGQVATLARVADALGIHLSTASRVAKEAAEGGFLVSQKIGKQHRVVLTLGEPLPDKLDVLPSAKTVRKHHEKARS